MGLFDNLLSLVEVLLRDEPTHNPAPSIGKPAQPVGPPSSHGASEYAQLRAGIAATDPRYAYKVQAEIDSQDAAFVKTIDDLEHQRRMRLYGGS